jgi:endonuclease IV
VDFGCGRWRECGLIIKNTGLGYSPDYILPHGSYLINLGQPDEYVNYTLSGRQLIAFALQDEKRDIVQVFPG